MKQEDQQRSRSASIVKAAMGCFIDRGFHATSMRDIASAASVSLGNLYNYFPGKQALIAEVANQEQAELAQLLHTLDDVASPSMAHVRQFLEAYWHLCRQREWAILSIECLAEIARSPVLLPAFERNRKQLLDTLAHVIERARKAAVFKPAAPTRVVAQALLDIVESDALRQALMAEAAEAGHHTAPATQADAVLQPGLLRGLLGS